MTDPVILGFIALGGTFITVVGGIRQQALALKTSKKEREEIKKVATETKEVSEETLTESKENFEELKTLIEALAVSSDLMLQNSLRHLLTQHQNSESISYADKEIIDKMYAIYIKNGHNGTVKGIYENFISKLKVTS